jgi:DNA-binding MarR family transcriptional regulator
MSLTKSSTPLGRSVVELIAAAGQPVTRSEIRKRLGMTESHLSHLLRDLESAGMIVRARPGKGREILVDLGPQGRATVEAAVLPRWVDRLAGLIAGGTSSRRSVKELAETLIEEGAPSLAAAERLAGALAGLAPYPTGPVRSQEIREPSLAEAAGDFPGPVLRPWVEEAAAESGQSVSDYCRQAVRERLAAEGLLPGAGQQSAAEAAQALDRLRRKVGPIGVPVRELIQEGRRR